MVDLVEAEVEQQRGRFLAADAAGTEHRHTLTLVWIQFLSEIPSNLVE